MFSLCVSISFFLRLRTCKTCTMLGDVTTVNLTGLEGGVQQNVVPSEFIAKFDIRVSPKTDMDVS